MLKLSTDAHTAAKKGSRHKVKVGRHARLTIVTQKQTRKTVMTAETPTNPNIILCNIQINNDYVKIYHVNL